MFRSALFIKIQGLKFSKFSLEIMIKTLLDFC